MKLEAIIICVGKECSDFLDYTLPLNKKFFDNIIVVTSIEDRITQDICLKNSVFCVPTNSFYKNGGKFRKGAGYNEGIKYIKFGEFICLMDSDVVIPDIFGRIKNQYNWNIEEFYGVKRIIFRTISEFNDYLIDKIKDKDLWIPDGIGYGFWSIFHCKSQIIQKWGFYYSENDGVGHGDYMLRNLWGDCINNHKEYTGLLRELPMKVYHLGWPGGFGAEKV